MDDYDDDINMGEDGDAAPDDPPAQNAHNAQNPDGSADVGPRGEGEARGRNDPGGGSGVTGANVGEVANAGDGPPAPYRFEHAAAGRGGGGLDEGRDLAEAPHPDSFDPAEPTPGLTHKQEQAILALLAEPTVARAAASCKVGVRTMHRWLREEVFGKAYRLARRETFAQAVSLTQRYAGLAVQTLARVMTDESAPTASRVAAATSMLKFARDSIELDDLADRVEALERSAKEKAA